MIKKIDSKVGHQHYTDDYFQDLYSWYKDGKFQNRIENIISKIDFTKGKLVLDVGCGIGTFTVEAAKKGATAIGLDYSERSMSFAKNLILEKCVSKQASLIRGDAEKLQFNENLFDVVLAADVIEHVYHPKKFLAEVKRVLKPSGILAIQTDNTRYFAFNQRYRTIKECLKGIPFLVWLNAKIKREEQFLVKLSGDDNYQYLHVSLFELGKLKKLVEEVGFIITHYDTFGWWHNPLGVDRIVYKTLNMPLLKIIFRDYKQPLTVLLCVKPCLEK